MKNNIHQIFSKLLSRNRSIGDLYSATALPESSSHKLGITETNAPVFFIASPLLEHSANISLDLISVLFNQPCKLRYDESPYEDNGVYTVVILKTNQPELGWYFVDVMALVLSKIGDYPDSQTLVSEMNKLVELFRSLTKPSKNTIQGLWAELFVVTQSMNPEYLIESWHTEANDIYDFNDGVDKIEVKSTSSTNRKHHFSLRQLNPNDGANLVISSVFVISSGRGMNILGLMNCIENKIQRIDLRFKLNEIVSKTLGADFEKAMKFHFDYQLALDSYLIYDYMDIPRIETHFIPQEISDVHFGCDITGVKPISNLSAKFPSSKLFKALDSYEQQ